jgi:glutamyl-tRNA reductase
MQVIGIDHHRTDATTIARLGRAADALRAALADDPAVSGFVVLATCARVEAFVDSPRAHEAQRTFVGALADASGITREDLAVRVRVHRGPDALEHAFRVTTGLESAVVGEAQITGQVRAALVTARAHGTVTRSLGMALENAVRVSRQARPLLGSTSTSIAEVALDLLPATQGVGTALVIGTGAFARECAASLRARGAHTVWSHSPSGRTEPMPGADGTITADELPHAIGLSDVVVAASGSVRVVVSKALAEEAARHAARGIVIADLAGGSDIDPAVAEVPAVTLIRLDDVTRSAGGIDAASDLVREEALALFPRLASSDLDDLLVALRRVVEQSVVDGTDAIGDAESGAAQRRLTQALLHEPMQRARAAARDGRLDQFRAALETVFGPLSVEVARDEESAA